MATSTAEQARIEALRDAESKAAAPFEEAVRRGLVAAGVTEQDLSDRIRDLVDEMYGIRRFCHKRIVRSGRNTMAPYRENPPNLTIAADDIVFVDFGPVLEEWEADFGRTYVLGDDPVRHRLAADLPRLWEAGRDRFREQPDITGEQLYRFVLDRIADAGWEHPETHTGHLVGEFPHERIDGEQRASYITDGNTAPLQRPAPVPSPDLAVTTTSCGRWSVARGSPRRAVDDRPVTGCAVRVTDSVTACREVCSVDGSQRDDRVSTWRSAVKAFTVGSAGSQRSPRRPR